MERQLTGRWADPSKLADTAGHRRHCHESGRRPRRVDSHHHVWDGSLLPMDWMRGELAALARPFSVTDYHAFMLSADFSGAVLVEASGNASEAEFLLGTAADSSLIRAVVLPLERAGLAHPRLSDRLAALRDARGGELMAGFRWSAQTLLGPHWLTDPACDPGLRLLQRNGLSLDLSIRPDEWASVATAAKRYPDLRIIIDHCGNPPLKGARRKSDLAVWSAGLIAAARSPNVYVKLSGLVSRMEPIDWKLAGDVVAKLAETLGPARIMLGSDWPVCTVRFDPVEAVEAYRRLLNGFSSTEIEFLEARVATQVYFR
jgi:L-fuconolactonase